MTEAKEKKYAIEIEQDTSGAMNDPRETHDNVGTMACWHLRYDLGDEQPEESLGKYLLKLDSEALVLPLHLYAHSGLTMRTTPFASNWDSGKVGIIWVSQADIDKEWAGDREKAKSYLEGEVATYDLYLRGEVWAFYIFEECTCCGQNKPGSVDSCHGHLGEDIDCIKDSIPSGYVTDAQIQEAWDNRGNC